MTFKVLFVCAANVCRSPTGAAVLAAHLSEGLARSTQISSAGVAAENGQEWCSIARTWVRRHHLADVETFEHHSRRVTQSRIRRADLVLASDTAVKSAVLKADLECRDRLFLVTEAAALAAGVGQALRDVTNNNIAQNGLELEALPRRVGDVRLTWLTQEMHAARGLIAAPPRRRFRRESADIADPHAPGSRSHRHALRRLSGAAISLGASFEYVNAAEV